MGFFDKLAAARKEQEDIKRRQSGAKMTPKAGQARIQRGLNLDAPVGTVTICRYTEKEMADLERDVTEAGQKGWNVEQVAAQGGHTNIGRTVAKGIATGGIGLLALGASRTKGIVILRFTRLSN